MGTNLIFFQLYVQYYTFYHKEALFSWITASILHIFCVQIKLGKILIIGIYISFVN